MEITKNMVVITGAGSGLGAETARYLHGLGANLALIDKDEANLAKVAKELESLYFAADVTSEEDIEKVFTSLKAEGLVPRVCVNCAGIVLAQKMHSSKDSMGVATFKKVIDVNLVGTFNVMQQAVKHMLELDPLNDDGERGVVINTASVAAFEGQMGQVAYSASKGGVVAMSLPAARELAVKGIRVNTLAPGLMDTPMLASLPEAAKESLLETTLFPKRLGHGEEFAKLVAHVIENTLLNGATLRLDGAVRLSAS